MAVGYASPKQSYGPQYWSPNMAGGDNFLKEKEALMNHYGGRT